MKISIFGLGYVGAVSLACLVRDKHEVIGVDIDPRKLDLIRSGQSPIIEEGIQELMLAASKSGRLQVSDDVPAAIASTRLSFVCVGTPADRNGDQDLAAIRRVAEQIGEGLARSNEYHVVVIRSTVKPGTVQDVVQPILEQASGKVTGKDFGLCFQPEFLREGTSIKDYDAPPYTIVGGDSENSINVVREVFEHLACEFYSTDIRTAEMLKYACNTFHALKITFANEMGRLAQSLQVDSRAVMDLVCKDRHLNISPAYLKPGFAFGGSCLPKDVKALLYMGKSNDVETPMLSGLLPSNRIHVEHALEQVFEENKRRIGMIGLSFKSGTDDLRESPLVTMAEQLIGKGMDLRIYDPEVHLSRLIGANRRYIEESIPHIGSLMCENLDDLLEHAEVLVVGLSDRAILDALYGRLRSEQLVLDLVNIPERERLGARYKGICW